MRYSRIAGTGRYLPERVLTNTELEVMVDTSDEWIRARTGIERRHIAAEDQTTLDLAEQAARQAMTAAGVGPADIDFIVVGTTTPDVVFPNLGCLLQERLGVAACPAFALEAACSGFIYALGIADRFVSGGMARCALVVGAETLSRITDWTDRSTCVIFGDGAGAVIVQPADEPGIISAHLAADGRYKDLLYFPYGPSRRRRPEDTETAAIHMRGNEVFKVAVKTLESIVDTTLAANNLERGQIDWLIPHQANIRIIQATARRLDMPMDKVVLTLMDHGNTSAASVPMALDVAVRDGRIKRGDLLLLEAFGGGFTWGSVLLRY
ncbi:MAG: ketoacyl-ACP synthase III [Chromatiales bacterium]|nr:ketoacyl-ACP synthase III [Chromatiales bacterium]